MSFSKEAIDVLRRLKWKFIEVFDENVEGLWDEVGSQGLLTHKEMTDLLSDPRRGAEEVLNIILQKGEGVCQKFFHHLENMILRFPSLSGLSLYFPENKWRMFQKLLDVLNMKHLVNSKLTLTHILEIGAETFNDDDPQTIKNIPWSFLKKLMASNRAALTQYESGTGQSIHPLDVLCILLHCSDSFLQQEIVTKMSMCQFAVPLLLPSCDGSHSTLMLWAMRDIVKEWRPCSLTDSKVLSKENLVNVSMPIFSFIRLGNTKLSKSKILNQVLNSRQHTFFIHDNVEGGNIERKISDGLVEMSWYFPCDESDVFSEPIAVANLRGDLETNLDQFMFLTRVSTAVFIFIESISARQCRLLSSFSEAETQFYLIVTPENGQSINLETSKHISSLMKTLHLSSTNIIQKSSEAIGVALVKKIQNAMETALKTDQKQKRNLCSIGSEIQGLPIIVDEDSVECQRAKEKAGQILSLIKDVEEYKKETLKLQGELWRELSKVEKELCRMANQGNKNAQEYQSELKLKLKSLHQKQYQHEVPVGLLYFKEAITDVTKVEIIFFLKWMTFGLESIARKNQNSWLGIEHFIRELGQFYEAEYSMTVNQQNKETTRRFAKLPGIIADLLIDGIPLEFFDGGAANIPLQWIADVMTELDNKTGGQCKMKVITVLGAQGTGKSTILNTMFGLQFPEGSTRCTQGAFMTLLKVHKNFHKELGCEFILVINTEGLKAPETASFHNNELITLVVGLSNITVINMAMENPSEIKDILQIVVRAFLQMKEIEQKPSCQFVYQNVSHVSAQRDGKTFLEQLDEMTRVAAKLEKKSGITSFSDVMDYDPEMHNWYIPGLWQEVPPMATENVEYSKNVYAFKKHLLGFLKSPNPSGTHSKKMTDFVTLTKSLWSALKHESFISSFRNGLGTEAYNKLSIRYTNWEWNFTKSVDSWMTTIETHIRNQKSAASLTDDMLSQFKVDLQNLLQKEEYELLKLLQKYFENKSENVHLTEENKKSFSSSVESLRKELEINALGKLNRSFLIQKSNFAAQETYKTSQELIEETITNLLKSCRERNCDAKTEFEEKWKKTMTDLQIKEMRRHNTGQTILQKLKNGTAVKGVGVTQYLNRVTSLDEYGNRSFVTEFSHIDQRYFHLYSMNVEKIQHLAGTLIGLCDSYIKENNTGYYKDIYFHELLRMINAKLKDPTTQLHYSPKFEVDIKLHIFGKAAKAFSSYEIIYLERLKPQYLATFENIIHERDECQIRAKAFCDLCLKPALTAYILRHLGQEVIEDIMQSSDHHMFSSRSTFQFAILKDLLEKKEFEHYWSYIKSYTSFLKEWIYQHITNTFQSETLKPLEEKLLSSIVKKTGEVLKSEECLEAGAVEAFLESFCKLLNNELVISQNQMRVITFHNAANVQQFSEDILSYLPNIKEDILSDTEMLDIKHILSRVDLKPQDELLKKVLGCGKQCPFCMVSCENTGGGHQKHEASLHRPQGLGGYRWAGDGTLIIDICSTSVVSNAIFKNCDTKGKYHPYKEYRTYYPDWAIQPDASLKSSDYWKYIFCRFNNEFAKKYNAKPARLPEDWKEITEEHALASLQESFKI